MPENDPKPLESILRHCAGAAPAPWYPSEFAKAQGIDRNSLDAPLEKLWLGGLIQLTDWEQGKGQGRRLTPEGTALLNNPKGLARLQNGELPQPAAPKTPAAERGTSTWDRGEAAREAVLNAPRPVVTPILIAINVLIFLTEQQVRPDSEIGQFLARGQVVWRFGIARGEWWRLLTCCFFHGNQTHLFMNMFSLLILGWIGERIWGPSRFLILYLLSGVGGSVAVVLTTNVPALGASGAICGLFAAQAVWLWLNRHAFDPDWVSYQARVLVINAVLVVGISFWPGVSWAGHLGGALAGFFLAFLLYYQRFGAVLQRFAALLGLLLFPAACIGMVLWQMETSVEWRPFLGLMKDFDQANGLLEWGKKMARSTLRVVREDVLPTTERPPVGRNPAAVHDLLLNLAQRQVELQNLLGQMIAREPFPDERLEVVRHAAESLLSDSIKLCQLAQGALKVGGDWKARHEALNKAVEEFAQLRLQ